MHQSQVSTPVTKGQRPLTPVAAVDPHIPAQALDQDAGDQGLGIVAPDLVLPITWPLGHHEGMDDVLHDSPTGRAAGRSDLGHGLDDVAQRPTGPAIDRRLKNAGDAGVPDHLPDLGQDRAVLTRVSSRRSRRAGNRASRSARHSFFSVLHDDVEGWSPAGRQPRRGASWPRLAQGTRLGASAAAALLNRV